MKDCQMHAVVINSLKLYVKHYLYKQTTTPR